MPTQTEIANMACDFLDIDPIGNLASDMSASGQYLRRNYQPAVDTVTSEFSWNEARTYATLNEITVPDSFARDATDHQNVYSYPADCMGLIEINGRPIEEVTHDVATYVEVGPGGEIISRRRVILCDIADSIIILYKAKIDAADMGPHLAKAVALELAERCVAKARNSGEALARIQDMYKKATRGDGVRVGGFQVASRERHPKKAVIYPSTGARARAGDI